jgi:hypothetical protein
VPFLPLLQTPSPYQDESLAGYLIRLAEFNYYPSPQSILKLIGWQKQRHFKLVKSSHELSLLSQLIKVQESELWRMAEGGKVKVEQEEIKLYPLSQFSRKFCPLCLEQLAYFRKVWDSELIKACPFHQCLLITKCPQCQQSINGLRSQIIKCQCGFDFRQSDCQIASPNQVNLAYYLFSLEGDEFCRHCLAQIYGRKNPIFYFNKLQFNRLVKFLDYHLHSYLISSISYGDSQPPDYKIPELIKLSQTMAWGEFICYLFSKWKNNFRQLFRWFEQELFLLEYPRDALMMLCKFLISLANFLPEKSAFLIYVELELLRLLKRHQISEIEVIWSEGKQKFSKVSSLQNLNKFLKELAQQFNIPNLTLARLLDSTHSLFLFIPNSQSHVQGSIICRSPLILQCEFINWELFFQTYFSRTKNPSKQKQ